VHLLTRARRLDGVDAAAQIAWRFVHVEAPRRTTRAKYVHLKGSSTAQVPVVKIMLPEYETEIAALELKHAAHPTGSLVFYGSSSMRLWPRLARDFPDGPIENWGFGGSTLAQCAHFFERASVPRRPRAIVFYGGDNDLALGASPQGVWDSLRVLLDARDAHLGPIPFAFLSIKPSPARLEIMSLIVESNEWCRREIAGRHNSLWVEVFAPMLDSNGAPRPLLFVADGLHLSRVGYDLWREVLKREVDWLNE